MNYTRLYTGDDHQSHFEDLSFELIDADYGQIVNPLQTEQVILGHIGKTDSREIDWHNPPVKQYVVMLEGATEIEIGSGEKRVFKAGDILLADDLEGQGHISRAVCEGDIRYLVVPVAA